MQTVATATAMAREKMDLVGWPPPPLRPATETSSSPSHLLLGRNPIAPVIVVIPGAPARSISRVARNITHFREIRCMILFRLLLLRSPSSVEELGSIGGACIPLILTRSYEKQVRCFSSYIEVQGSNPKSMHKYFTIIHPFRYIDALMQSPWTRSNKKRTTVFCVTSLYVPVSKILKKRHWHP